jgi:hypothetical protein
VQIGGWLRNPYSVYSLKINKGFVKKYHLVGKEMSNYVKPSDLEFDENILNLNSKVLQNSKSDIICGNIVDGTNTNKYVYYMNEYIKKNLNKRNISNSEKIKILKENHNSVILLNCLSDYNYDVLLSKNIVFVNLVDVSACNTLIECVVRNTPIIINRLPAVIEILGKKYPLYYDNLDEVNELLDLNNIVKAHEYLTTLNKERFTIENFIKKIINSTIFTKALML